MDQIYRRPVLHRELRVLKQKEDRDLQHKLNMLEKQYRFTRKMLQQRRDWLMNEKRRLVMVKICEPKATVSIAIKEIGECNDTGTHVRGIHTSDGGRLRSSKSQYDWDLSRSASAPAPPSVKPTGPVRHRGNVWSSVSLMQMKAIATIDSISEKELARRQKKAREETERARQLQRETIHRRVAAFIESLKDKGNTEILEDIP